MPSFKLLTIWSLLLFIGQFGFAANLPDGFSESTIATELNPTAMTITPDGRIFILEKDGRVLVVENDQLLPDPLIELAVDFENERGLGGIALDPNFANNNYFYLYYTVPGANHNRVSRFTANGNSVVAGSEVQILDLDELTGSVHNGGAMAFGADGKLYIATGEGGKPVNSQDMTNLLGKILRINKDGSIPEDNPFYDELSGKNRAIWALGLRNPFSFAIDPATGTILVNDVGQSGWEEVNKIVKGKNYGWPLLEGKNRKNKEEPENYQEPLYDYNHQTGCSIIGAAFYNPQTYAFPEQYHGKYFFGDYCKGFIKVLDPETGEEIETFATGVARPLAFIVSPDGSFYYLERGNSGGNTSANRGALVKVTHSGDLTPFISGQPASQEISLGGNATFTVNAGGKEPLTFQWYKNGEAIEGENTNEISINNVGLDDDGTEFHVTITNEHGTVTSEKAVLNITENTAPQVVIDHLNPNPYKAGDTLSFSGYGVDGEDGNLPGSALSWRIDFHHNDHTHPALELLEGTDIGEYVIPRIGETSDNVWYRIYLTATDSQGAEKTVFRDVQPMKSDFEVQSQPEGLTVYLDGAPVTTPTVTTSVVGVTRELRAPASQEVEGTLYLFDHWSDGSEELEISFNNPEENSTWVAIYQEAGAVTGQGLQAAYYGDENSEEAFSGDPVVLRVDEQIDFDWRTEPAAAELPADGFEVRWVGLLEPMVSGLHTFYASADGGVRLWVNEELLIDQWDESPVTEATGTIELEAGQSYMIKVEYLNKQEEAFVKLEWSTDQMERAVIPVSQLFPLPYLVSQPSAQVSSAGGEATFTVMAAGEEPVTYQWYKNGEAIEGENTAALTLSDLSLDDEGAEYYVTISNQFGTITSEKAVLSFIEMYIGTGEGLQAAYYGDENSEEAFSGDPVVLRVDEQIDFDWRTEPAAAELPADGFEVRWSGLLEPMVSGLHTFYASADGGVRLWVNEELLIDQWDESPVTDATGTIELEAGQPYMIKVEYLNNQEEAFVKLEWSTDQLQRAVIPGSQLYPDETVTGINDKLRSKVNFMVYPVPTDQVLNIKLSDASYEKMPQQVSVLNSIGAEVIQRQPVLVDQNHWQIDVSSLPTGMYFIRNNESSYIIKFLKK